MVVPANAALCLSSHGPLLRRPRQHYLNRNRFPFGRWCDPAGEAEPLDLAGQSRCSGLWLNGLEVAGPEVSIEGAVT